jgi:hypothetical protein
MRASRCRFAAALSSLLLTALPTAPAEAFEYKEHRDVSNEGFVRAQKYINDTYGKCLATPEITELKPKPDFFAESVSFGDLVALVDYVADPNDFVTPSKSHSLNKDRIRKLNTATRALHSAHNDNNHYQERALSSFWLWHRIAMQEARAHGGDLQLALAYSAFSLHFLEDFFAPGHIRTPRPDLHDAAAMNIHDRFNWQGQLFKVEAKTLPELEPFLPTEYGEFQKQENKSLFLLGDGGLGSPRVRNRLQATFLAALVGRAIADVFESYLDANGPEVQRCSGIQVRNHFEDDWQWEPYEVPSPEADNPETLSPLACIHYGCYEQVTDQHHPLGVTVVFAIDAGAQALLSADTVSRAQGDLSVGPVFLLSPSGGWRSGLFERAIQAFGGIEWNHVFARGYRADGIRARFYFPITALDLQLTASTTYRWYGGNFSGDQRWAWDGGVQFGYGLVFVGLCAGRQDVLNEMNSRLTPAWTLTGNVTLMVSHTIFCKLGKDREIKFNRGAGQ